MNKLPKCIELAEYHANKAIDRAEFYKTKSQASYRKESAKNCQDWAEFYSDVSELLRELVMYRNAIVGAKVKINWSTRLIERKDNDTLTNTSDAVSHNSV